MTPTPQEELKAVKARARKAAAKARAEIAKEIQKQAVFARDADRAREEARRAQEEAAHYKECYFKVLAMFENEVTMNCDNTNKWVKATTEAAELRAENASLRRELERSRQASGRKLDSSKIWEVCQN